VIAEFSGFVLSVGLRNDVPGADVLLLLEDDDDAGDTPGSDGPVGFMRIGNEDDGGVTADEIGLLGVLPLPLPLLPLLPLPLLDDDAGGGVTAGSSEFVGCPTYAGFGVLLINAPVVGFITGVPIGPSGVVVTGIGVPPGPL
jgi:hypothetical protein